MALALTSQQSLDHCIFIDMSSLIQPLRFRNACKPALLVPPRAAAAAGFHSSVNATTETSNSAVNNRYFKLLKASSSNSNSTTQQRSYPYTNHASGIASPSPAATSLFSTTTTAATGTTDDVTAQTRSLYRRYCRTVPRLLQQYQIRKTSKLAAIQHIRSNHIQKYIQSQQQSQQSDSPVQMDPRYQQLLLHKAELQLYDLLSGYCTRREVKQLLCGAESVPAVPVSSVEQQHGSIVSTVPPTKHQKMLQKHRNQRHEQQQVSYQSQAVSDVTAQPTPAATVINQVKQHVAQTSTNLQQLLSSQRTQNLVQPQAA